MKLSFPPRTTPKLRRVAALKMKSHRSQLCAAVKSGKKSGKERDRKEMGAGIVVKIPHNNSRSLFRRCLLEQIIPRRYRFAAAIVFGDVQAAALLFFHQFDTQFEALDSALQ